MIARILVIAVVGMAALWWCLSLKFGVGLVVGAACGAEVMSWFSGNSNSE